MDYNLLPSPKSISLFGLDWLLLLFVALAFMFYFSRVVGTAITWVCKLVVWPRYKVSIHVQSFSISPIAGHIFVKNFSIVTKDFTFCVLEASITWRYWLFRVRKSRLQQQTTRKASSRFVCELHGLEMFIYNRSYAFDYVARHLGSHSDLSFSSSDSKESNELEKSAHNQEEKGKIETASSTVASQTSSWVSFLPLEFVVHKFGLVIGNENTTSIVVAAIDNATGDFDLSQAASALDIGRSNFFMTLNGVVVQLKPNVSYKQPISSSYLSDNFNIHEEYIKKRKARRFRRYKTVWAEFLKLTRLYKHRHSPAQRSHHLQWRGLPQYLDDTDSVIDVVLDEISQEYAIYRTIVEAPKCDLHYYYDTPGEVLGSNEPPSVGPDVGNSGNPPQFGVDIVLSDSKIYYGPWADRQRVSFFKAFFPQANNFEDVKPKVKLGPGDTRIYTFFNFSIQLDSSILRIPMREYSKDLERSLVKERPKPTSGSDSSSTDEFSKDQQSNDHHILKPFAWLELKITDSMVSMYTELENGENGSNTKIDVVLKHPELRSSLNHNIFYTADEHSLTVDLNYPLKWNDITVWNITNSTKNCDLFILRDHVTLISDLLTDFASPEKSLATNPTELLNSYNLFRPYEYRLKWEIDGAKVFLNINNQNIVENPIDFDDNTYLSFQTKLLNIDLAVPMDAISSKSSTISFNLASGDLGLHLDTPAWNTLNTFMKKKRLAYGTDLKVKGSYTYYSEVEPNLVDTVDVKCFLSNTTFQAYGVLVKSIMDIKENYFGENTHFQTLEEYAGLNLNANDDINDSGSASVKKAGSSEDSIGSRGHFRSKRTPEPKQVRRIENEIDVLFSFCVDNGCLVLPCHLYDSDTFLCAKLASFDIDIRFTNYYMDLQCDISPLKWSYQEEASALDTMIYVTDYQSDMFMDGIVIHGHRVFGIPPVEPTYICKWNISSGAVSLNTTTKFITAFKSAIMNIGYTFDDLENALVVDIPTIYDVTLFSFSCPVVSIALTDESKSHVLHVSLKPVSLKMNDLSNSRYTSGFDLKIKQIAIDIQRNNQILLYTNTAVAFTNFCRKRAFKDHQVRQQAHLKLHDGPFHRIPYFLQERNRDAFYLHNYGKIAVSMSVPDIPMPLTAETLDTVLETMPLSKNLHSFDSDFESGILDSSSDTDSEPTSENDTTLHDFLPKPHLKVGAPKGNSVIYGENTVFDVSDNVTPMWDMSDESYEYDNLIINLASLAVYASPLLIESCGEIFKDFGPLSPENVLDTFQVEVNKKLLDQGLLSATNLRFITPKMSVFFGMFNEHVSVNYLANQVLEDMTNIFVEEPISINCDAPSLVLSSQKKFLAAVHVPKVEVSRKKSIFSIEGIEAWASTETMTLGSLNVSRVDCSLNAAEVESLFEIIKQYEAIIVPTIEKLQAQRKSSVTELMYKLCVASDIYNIHDDSMVLTKPTYIIRNSQSRHLRTFDSWRILVRFRHILNSLPKDWEQNLPQLDWCNALLAEEKIMDNFSRWRSWETSNIENALVFTTAFHKEKSDSNGSQGALFALGDLCMSLDDSLGSLKSKDYFNLRGVDGEVFFEDIIKVSLDVTAIDSRVSPVIFAFFDIIEDIKKRADDDKKTKEPASSGHLEPSNQESNPKKVIQTFVTIQSLTNTIAIEKLNYKMSVTGITNSNLIILDGDDCSLSCIAHYDELLMSLNNGVTPQLMIGLHDFDLSVIGNVSETMVFNGGLKACNIDGALGSLEYLKTLENFEEYDIPWVQKGKSWISRFSQNQKTQPGSASNLSSPGLPLDTLKIRGDFEVSNVSWNVEVLSPILITGSASHFKVDASLFDGIGAGMVKVGQWNTDLIHNSYGKKFLVRLIHNDLQVGFRGQISEPIKLLLRVESDSLVISIPSALRSFNDLLNDKSQIEGIVDQYSKMFIRISEKLVDGSTSDSSIASLSSSKPPRMILKSICKFKTLQISCQFDETKGEFNLDRVSVLIGNNLANKCHYDIKFPSINVTLNDPIIPPSLSKIVDFNISVRLSSSKDAQSSKQTAEVTSEYFLVGLSPYTAVKLLEIKSQLKEIRSQFESIEKKEEPGPSAPEFSVSNIVEKLRDLSIHILSYNFCFGWLFSSDQKGLVFGCEKVYVFTEETLGKLTIVNGYLSIPTTKFFSLYTTDTPYSPSQRALLPNVQMIFALNRQNSRTSLDIRVTGEVLDVRLMSKHFQKNDSFTKSIATFQRLRRDLIPEEKQTSQTAKVSSEDYMNTIGDFSSIKCLVNFAGAFIRVEQSTDSDKALELRSPAIEMCLDYKKAFKHVLRMEITTFSSDNTLDSSCIPVLSDILRSVNSIAKQQAKSENSDLEHDRVLDPTPEHEAMDYTALWQNLDMSASLNIQPQSLSLSCAPNAKIKAVVSSGPIKLQFNTFEEASKLVSGSLLFNDITAKLQHVYSREVSASVGVGQVMLNAMVYPQESMTRILSSGAISKVRLYVKTSQLQDLSIFIDTWMGFVKTSDLSGHKSPTTRSQSFAEKFQQVSKTKAFPWNVNFVVADIGLEVDLGQQLGIASLNLDKAWLAQGKSSGWEQNLVVGVDSLVLKCEGRLSCEVALLNLRLNSVIMWANEGAVFEIPLVFVCGGLESIRAIVAFDYHTVLVSMCEGLYLSLFNQRDQNKENLDRLTGVAHLRRVQIHATCLVASTMIDITNAFLRILENTQASYNEVMSDEGTSSYTKKGKKLKDYSILEKFTKLTTQVGVTLERFIVQIYPDSLLDQQVFIIDSGRLCAKYIRRLDNNQLFSKLWLQWNNLDVALSKVKKFGEKTISFANIEQFSEHALGAKGGTILMLPRISIAMETVQTKGSKEVQYKFHSSFGGNVDIRWHLKSVNFIRGMYDTHEKAVSARIARNKAATASKRKSLPPEDLDSLKFKARFEHAEHDNEYTYVAIVPSVIEPPQLKELGDVTPPLEWFGVHRKNFPALTHYFFILPLEEFVKNVEARYNSILGKA